MTLIATAGDWEAFFLPVTNITYWVTATPFQMPPHSPGRLSLPLTVITSGSPDVQVNCREDSFVVVTCGR